MTPRQRQRRRALLKHAVKRERREARERAMAERTTAAAKRRRMLAVTSNAKSSPAMITFNPASTVAVQIVVGAHGTPLYG
jgi:hypothetical protein